ncbi:MAG: DUF2461 domain-containing protein [Bacteroidota bacterium]
MDLHPILDFLTTLRANNNKAWMDTHKSLYHQVRDTWLEATTFLIQGMAPLDPLVANLTTKECVFRINRDIRFSKDKSPYKNNMGAFLAPGGKKGGYAGYYLHLEPENKSFIAGGIYQPSSDTLKQVRQEIDYQAEELIDILQAPRFQQLFGTLQGEKLKKVPRGYDSTHPQAELLKMKSYLVMHPVTDKQVMHKNFLSEVLQIFQAIIPFNQFLNRAVDG